MESLFDTINGLPLHPLAVHFVVILLPLAAIATIAIAVRPAWRKYSVPLMVFTFITFIMTFVAKEAGEALAHRVVKIGASAKLEDHAEGGDLLLILSFALFLGAIAIHFLKNKPSLMKVIAVLAVIGSLAVVVVTITVGESGATMVWHELIVETNS